MLSANRPSGWSDGNNPRRPRNPRTTAPRTSRREPRSTRSSTRSHAPPRRASWHEGVLSPTRLSFFAGILPDQPAWPRHPLGPGYDAGLDIASAEELVHELTTDDTSSKPRGKYRTIYTVVTRVEHQTRSGAPEIEIAGAGAFLTRSEAEDFQARLKPVVADSWVEEIPIAI